MGLSFGMTGVGHEVKILDTVKTYFSTNLFQNKLLDSLSDML